MSHLNINLRKSGPTNDPRAGLNLVEILIALAIFSIGVAQVMAMFPTAVYSAAESVRSAQARTLSRSAFAEVEIDMRVPHLRGVVQSVPDSYTVEMRNGTESDDDEWAGYFLNIIARDNAGNIIRQSVKIAGNDDQDFFLEDELDPLPLYGDRLIVTRLALPPLDILGDPREGTVEGVSTTDRNMIVAEAPVPWDDTELNDGTFFLIFTSGMATRRPFIITDSDEVNRTLTCDFTDAEVDFIDLGVTGGDEFVIIGAPDSDYYAQPTPDFGDPADDAVQTFQPRMTRVVNGLERDDLDDLPDDLEISYTYAAIISNTFHPDYPSEHIARVDILVFHGFNQSLPPERNRRATTHHVYYVGRR